MRHLLICAAALLAFCSTQAFAEQWEHSYPVNGKPEVIVDANDGDVEVFVGSGQQVEARVIAHGWKMNQDLHVVGTQSGNRVELKIHHPNKGCIGFCFQSIRVELRVPRESDLNVHTGDGKVRADGIRGNLQLETNDGDIQIRDAEGSLHAETHDGNVNVSGRFDFLSLHTGDGNIDTEVSSSAKPQPNWSFRTGDGNLRLRLPGEFAADIDAHSGDGHVNVDFPLTTSGSTRENSIRGKINGGGIPIELSTGDGNIAVEKM